MDDYSSTQKKEFVLVCMNWFSKNAPKNNNYYADGWFSVESKIADFIRNSEIQKEEEFLIYLNWLINFNTFFGTTLEVLQEI